MAGRRKKIAIFGCSFTGRYRRTLARAFNIAAEEMNVDLYYFNSTGKIGNIKALYIDYEADLFNYFDLSSFDGIVFDGEGYNIDGMSEKIIRKLREAKCAVASISSYVEGFYNIVFDDVSGLRQIIEHFINDHHFTRIGFMSGYLTHPDARARLAEFREVMTENGLPEDGVGMFEGDFWFNKGNEAADYFLSLSDRPEAIVCANDYMAIALCTALKKRGIRIPEDIAVSGFDGTLEGQEYLPHLTSVTRERLDLARKTLKLLSDLADGIAVPENEVHVAPKAVFSQSCGCVKLDFRHEIENINRIYELYGSVNVNVNDTEAAILRLNQVDNVRMMESIFAEHSVNFGDYTSFFMMLHTDDKGHPAYDSDFTYPSGRFVPVIWVDKNKEYTNSSHRFDAGRLIPETDSDRCHFYYIMCVHWAGKIFGYAVIEMAGKEIFDEFYNMWLLNLSMTVDAINKNDYIRKLIGKLENLSTKDELTGMYNRRGFESLARDTLSALRERKTVCTMVIDIDGLKNINDKYGHYEGDRAIRAAADIISSCCDSGEIAGRAGGDEFYIFAADYSDALLTRFTNRIKAALESYNENCRSEYKLDMSMGADIVEADSYYRLEDLLHVSDSRMYEQKLSKPGRRH